MWCFTRLYQQWLSSSRTSVCFFFIFYIFERLKYEFNFSRDLDNTACPGNAFYNEIKTWTNYRSLARFNMGPRFNVPEDYLVMQDM